MILDILENAHRYLVMNKGFEKAIEFLLRPDLKELPVGKYEIDGERVYAIVSNGPGRKKRMLYSKRMRNTLISNWSWPGPITWDGSPSHYVNNHPGNTIIKLMYNSSGTNRMPGSQLKVERLRSSSRKMRTCH